MIFVYGSLLKGLPLSYILDDSDFLGDAVAGGVVLFDLGCYPAVKCGDGAVIGELYCINDETLQNLDRVEGFYPEDLKNSLYHRRKIKILLPAISTEVFAYFYNGSVKGLVKIECGDYREYVNF